MSGTPSHITTPDSMGIGWEYSSVFLPVVPIFQAPYLSPVIDAHGLPSHQQPTCQIKRYCASIHS